MLNMLLYILLTLVLGIAVIRRPPLALAGILCLFGLKQWAQGTMIFFVQHGTIPNLTLGLLILLGLVVKLTRGENVFRPYPAIGWCSILLYAYATLTLFWAPSQAKANDLLLQALPYIITLVVLAPLLISGKDDLRPAGLGITVFGGALALLILLQVRWFNRAIVFAGSQEMGSNPLAVAQMGGYIVLSAMLLHFRNLRLAGWAFRIGMTVLGLLLIVKSGSRGQFLGLLAALVLFVPMRQRVDNPLKLVAFLVTISIVTGLAIWIQSSFTTEATIDQRWTSGKMAADMVGRFQNLQILLGIWSTSSLGELLFGMGNSASYAIRQLGIYPHFVPGEILAEEGLIGAGLYLAILWQAIKSIRETFRRVQDNPAARSELALFSAMFFFEFLITLKQGSLLGNTTFFCMAVILGRLRMIHTVDQPTPIQPTHLAGSQELLYATPARR